MKPSFLATSSTTSDQAAKLGIIILKEVYKLFFENSLRFYLIDVYFKNIVFISLRQFSFRFQFLKKPFPLRFLLLLIFFIFF